jgi:hypothetical protein
MRRRTNVGGRRRKTTQTRGRSPPHHHHLQPTRHTTQFRTFHLPQPLHPLRPECMRLKGSTQSIVRMFPGREIMLSLRLVHLTGPKTTQPSSSFPTPLFTIPETAHASRTCGLFSIPRFRSQLGWTIPSVQSLRSARSCRCFVPFSQRRLPSYALYFFTPQVVQTIRFLIPVFAPFILRAVSVVQQEPAHREGLPRLSSLVYIGGRATRHSHPPPLRANHQRDLLPYMLHASRSPRTNSRQGRVGPHGRGPRRCNMGGT